MCLRVEIEELPDNWCSAPLFVCLAKARTAIISFRTYNDLDDVLCERHIQQSIQNSLALKESASLKSWRPRVSENLRWTSVGRIAPEDPFLWIQFPHEFKLCLERHQQQYEQLVV